MSLPPGRTGMPSDTSIIDARAPQRNRSVRVNPVATRRIDEGGVPTNSGDGRSPAFPIAGLPDRLRKPGFRKSLASG